MPRLQIDNIDDPRIAVYRDLPRQNLTRHSGRFIAEGEKVALRLIDSHYPVESLLAEEEAADRLEPLLPAGTLVYVMAKPLLMATVGFHFHRGVLACGKRRAGLTANELVAAAARSQMPTIVVCQGVQDPTNLGSIIRSAAAFGCAGLIFGSHCADPFSRRVLRVSMGAALFLPIIESRDLEADLRTLAAGEFEIVATVLDPTAEPLAGFRRRPKTAVLFGSEGHGLPAKWQDLCQRRVTIPMQSGIDSLNVSVAAAVVLWEMTH